MKKFIQGSAILIIGDLLTKVISVLYLIPLVRIDDNIILLMTNLLIPFGFFIVFSSIGINLILTNELVKAKNETETKKVLINVGLIISSCTIIGALIMFLVSPALMRTIELNPEYATALTYGARTLTIGVFLFSITAYIRSILMAYGAYKIVSITFITEQIIRVSIILLGSYFTLVLHDSNVVVVVYIIVTAILISMTSTLIAYLYYFFKNKYHLKFVKGTYKFRTSDIKYLLVSTLILFAGGIYITLFDQIDLLLLNTQMLNHGQSATQINAFKNEYFTLSMKIVMVPISISSAFIQVMIKQIGESRNQKNEFNKIIYLVSLYSIFMFTSIMLLGNNAFNFLYGEVSTGIIVIQSLIIPVYIMKNVIGGYIITNQGKHSSILISTAAILLSKIILDVILFNLFSIYGYTLASIISLLIGIFILIKANKKLFMKLPITLLANSLLYIKAILLVIISALIFKLIPTSLPLFITITIEGILVLILFFMLFINNVKTIMRIK